MRIVKSEKVLTMPCLDSTAEDAMPIIDMLDTALQKTSGIGLAANQIGILRKVCIIRVPTKEGYTIGYNFVNPQITLRSEPIIFDEGCLSYPGQSVITIRYNKIIVEDALEPSGRELTGLSAICCQHETDHTLSKTMYMSKLTEFSDQSECPCGGRLTFLKCCKNKLKPFVV